VEPLIRYLLYNDSTNTNSNTNTITNIEPCSVFGRWVFRFESNGLGISVINLVILSFVAASIFKRLQVLSASIPSLWGLKFEIDLPHCKRDDEKKRTSKTRTCSLDLTILPCTLMTEQEDAQYLVIMYCF
jgi:hypothetical protein